MENKTPEVAETPSRIFEEDIEEIQRSFAKVLGPNGRYDLDGTLVRITSSTHGILWYGDLPQHRVRTAYSLGKSFNVPVVVESMIGR